MGDNGPKTQYAEDTSDVEDGNANQMQLQQAQQQAQQLMQQQQQQMQQQSEQQNQGQSRFRTFDSTGRRYPIRESRIKDRPQLKAAGDSALKIKIELDLEVEVDLYARVKGDVTIGLM
ncbi:hypothetical protein BP6252_06936 [Coleophoma cylindrospora]|uniref:Uncharacterized protein n=1 Tax=Coleophoma cylindrospora TaxID=1849047 RepID=A0A3D8RG51_9HELO|nr:hypothetical protein BP6252_06936 [Coleophoma cylindrospora]